MGGHAFSLKYHCPRLAPSLYNEVATRLLKQLQDLFIHAVVPPSAPEKTSFGDVDAIVCLSREADEPDLRNMKDRVKMKMGAVAAGVNKNGVLFLLRVLDGTMALSAPAFVQLDIQLCDAASQLPWTIFTIAYGDLINILKVGLYRSGLSLRPSGLFVRVPPSPEELQATAPTAANGRLLFLSNDVDAVLTFLDLDTLKYHTGFATMDELYGYAAGAKFFDAGTFADIVAGGGRDKRPNWVRFAREWLPQHH
ncbi:uncharacterized protein K452DRAFT_193739, partial [Aplosporella prunicola CBS 121167]